MTPKGAQFIMFHRFNTPRLLLSAVALLALLLVVGCRSAATDEPASTVAPPDAGAATEPTAAVTEPSGGQSTAATPQPTAAITGPVEAKVDRLVIAFTQPTHETNIPWFGARTMLSQFSPMTETLIDLAPATGEYTANLSTSWEMSPDGKNWTLNLREGVPFHFGFGEFTAKDVVHSRALMGQDHGVNTLNSMWRETVDTVEVVDDHQVVFRLTASEPDLDFALSIGGDLMMMSKDHWDQEGQEGLEQRVVGTGAYQYLEREVGQSILFERASDEHWRVGRGDFNQIQQVFAPEAATRLAMLLAEEAHVAALPRDGLAQAADNGMKIINSGIGGLHTMFLFGGLFYITGDEAYNPSIPWAAPGEKGRLVRQALNKAINRDDINEFIFKGGGAPYRVVDYHPTMPGWNPEWDERWEEEYGFDPDKSKELLTQAGYPDGFKMKIYGGHTMPGVPEMPDMAEALSIYFTQIGVDVEIVSVEFSVVRNQFRNKLDHEFLYPMRSSRRPLQQQIRVHNLPAPLGAGHFYESDLIVDKYDELTRTLDPVERDRIFREIGDHKFNNFASMPLHWLYHQIAVNPEIVAEYNFPGTAGWNFSHMETIKAVPK
jgi:peptide/nickel transport system substrate-binding protein